MKNLTKKYRLYAAYKDFSFIQLSNSRFYAKVYILRQNRKKVNTKKLGQLYACKCKISVLKSLCWNMNGYKMSGGYIGK